MFFEFDGTIINASAISQIISTKHNDEYKIIILRADGSFMASEIFDDAAKVTDRFATIKKFLIKE